MSNTVKQLGFIPTNRGEFDTTGKTKYYKDNVVQYRNGSYICSPVGYSSSNPTAYTTDAPYQDGDTQLNANWKLMASVGLVDAEPTAGSKNLVDSDGIARKGDSYPFVCNLNNSKVKSIKDVKIYGFQTDDVKYVQLSYFYNNRPSDHINTVVFTAMNADNTTSRIEAALGNDASGQNTGIKEYDLKINTTVVGSVLVDWDLAPETDFYGNTTDSFIILSNACFVQKIVIDNQPTQNSTNAVSSGGVWSSLKDINDKIETNVSPFTEVAERMMNVIPKLDIALGKVEHFAYKYAVVRFYNIEGSRQGRIARIAPDGTTELANFNVVDGQGSGVLYFGGLTDANHVSWLNIYIDLDQFNYTTFDGTMYIRSENIHMKYDSTPTTNSEKLVTSGGVKAYVDGKENSNSVFYKDANNNYTGTGSDMPLMVKALEITDKNYFDGYIWPQYIFNYSSATNPPRSNFTLKHTSEDGQTTTDIVVEGASNEGLDIEHEGIIIHNLLVGADIIGKIVVDWDLYKEQEYYGDQNTHLVKVKRLCYKVSNSEEYITRANDYSVKDDTKHIIKVDGGGHGDFTTIMAAVASITDGTYDNQYEVVVFPGIYYENDIHVPAYTHIHGLAPNSVIVSSEHLIGQTTLPVFDQEYASSKLSNMRIESHTGYCIHFDRALNGCSLRNENLYLKKFYHDGSNTRDVIGGGSFKDGTLYEWVSCVFDGTAGGSNADCHTNINANYENLRLVYKNCRFISCNPRVGSVGGFGNCSITFDGCSFEKSVVSYFGVANQRTVNEPWSYLVPNYEWQVLGSNNKDMAILATSTAKALQVIANSAILGQTIKLGGTALNDLFGPIVNYQTGGSSTIKASATGIYRVEDLKAGNTNDVFQMWKRLGDCSVTNKTLTVQIDDGDVQTYTFNQDYLTLKTSETDILTAINNVLSGCEIKQYSSGQSDAWKCINTTDIVSVVAASNIDMLGRWIDKTGHLCNVNTPAEDVLGISLSPAAVGDSLRVWVGESWASWSSLEEGESYGSNDWGSITKLGMSSPVVTIPFAKAITTGILKKL